MEQIPPQIAQKLHLLPQQPGIYIWKNAAGEVIYVGKARLLESRIKSYLNNSPKDAKTEQLLRHITDLDYIITLSEHDAFILEANLIRRPQPKYNILLKDDKRYPFVKITLAEPFPRIMVTRELVQAGSRFFGPFTAAKSLLTPELFKTASRLRAENLAAVVGLSDGLDQSGQSLDGLALPPAALLLELDDPGAPEQKAALDIAEIVWRAMDLEAPKPPPVDVCAAPAE